MAYIPLDKQQGKKTGYIPIDQLPKKSATPVVGTASSAPIFKFNSSNTKPSDNFKTSTPAIGDSIPNIVKNFEKPQGLVSTLVSKIPSVASSLAKDYLKSEGERRQGMSFGENAVDTLIKQPANLLKTVGVYLPRAIAGGFSSVGKTALEAVYSPIFGKENAQKMLNKSPELEKILFAGETKSWQQVKNNVDDYVNKSPLATNWEKKNLGITLAVGGFLSDAWLGGGGKAKTKLAEIAIKELAEATDEAAIRTILKNTKMPDELIEAATPGLVRATTPEEVNKVVTEASQAIMRKASDLPELPKIPKTNADEIKAPVTEIKAPVAENVVEDINKAADDVVERISKAADNSLENATTGSRDKSLDYFRNNPDEITASPVRLREVDGKIVIEDGRHRLEVARESGIKDIQFEDVTPNYTGKPSQMVASLTDNLVKTVGDVNQVDRTLRDSMGRYAGSTPIKSAVPVSERAELVEANIANLKDYVDNSPARELWDTVKNSARTVRNKDNISITNNLSDILAKAVDNPNASYKLKHLDNKIETLGYKDLDEAQEDLEKWLRSRNQLVELRKSRQAIRAELQAEKKSIPSQTKAQKAKLEKLRQERDRIQAREATQKMVDERYIDKKNRRNLQSLDEVAQQKLREVEDMGIEARPLIDMVEEMKTPVTKKVNMIDYLRTPDRILQKIGLGKESVLLRKQYDKYLEELPKNIDKITAWSKRVPGKESSVKIFKYLDGQPSIFLSKEEMAVAQEIRTWLAEWAERLKLPEDNKLSHYITHIFEKGVVQKEFDEDLAKIIVDKIPGSVYDPFLEKRLGKLGYVQDTWRALDAYVKRATRKVHMDPILERLEDVSGSLEESQWKYVKRYADRINLRPTETDNLIDNMIKSTPIGYKMGQRPVAAITRLLRQFVYRATLGGNLTSALKNLSQGANTYAKLGEKYTIIGYSKLLSKYWSKELADVGVLRQGFVEDRALSATRKFWEKFDKGLFFMFEQAEKINRGAAYYGAKSKALAKGKSESEAIEYAKKIVRDTQFQFGSIDTPVAMQGDLVKTLTQFKSFTVKQTEFLAEMVKNKEYAGILRYTLAGMAFVYTVGELFGMEPKDLIPNFRFDTPASLKLPVDIVKTATGARDQFGNTPSMSQRGKTLLKDALLFVPGSSQAKKLLEGKVFSSGSAKKETEKSSSGLGGFPKLPKLPKLPTLPKL